MRRRYPGRRHTWGASASRGLHTAPQCTVERARGRLDQRRRDGPDAAVIVVAPHACARLQPISDSGRGPGLPSRRAAASVDSWSGAGRQGTRGTRAAAPGMAAPNPEIGACIDNMPFHGAYGQVVCGAVLRDACRAYEQGLGCVSAGPG